MDKKNAEAIHSLEKMENALRILINEYDMYWVYGVSPDPVLEDIMNMSLNIRRNSKQMLNEVQANKARLIG